MNLHTTTAQRPTIANDNGVRGTNLKGDGSP